MSFTADEFQYQHGVLERMFLTRLHALQLGIAGQIPHQWISVVFHISKRHSFFHHSNGMIRTVVQSLNSICQGTLTGLVLYLISRMSVVHLPNEHRWKFSRFCFVRSDLLALCKREDLLRFRTSFRSWEENCVGCLLSAPSFTPVSRKLFCSKTLKVFKFGLQVPYLALKLAYDGVELGDTVASEISGFVQVLHSCIMWSYWGLQAFDRCS